MCSRYQAIKEAEWLRRFFSVEPGDGELQGEMWPLYLGPFIRRDNDALEAQRRLFGVGMFGMQRPHNKAADMAKQTYNARTETVAEKVTFKPSWEKGRRCIIPAAWICEPAYDNPAGKAEWWKIGNADGTPLGIAGLWNQWRSDRGGTWFTFTMLTVPAADHQVMGRFHGNRPEDKRMVVILEPAEYDRWLDCPVDQQMGMMRQYPAKLLATEPAPALPPRAKKVAKPKAPPPADDGQEGLF